MSNFVEQCTRMVSAIILANYSEKTKWRKFSSQTLYNSSLLIGGNFLIRGV